ncbi:MAG TPA: septal ring lytic transglycosylase RlpA family protein [Candidatus Binataceae bacterium]|nr:septal ring lytic transglycosylase RlpA family protein [Candidatus Binataceae bacterium]
MGRRGILSKRASWLLCATLWLGGCSAYNAAGVPSSPAVEPIPASSAGGRVTIASWYGPGFIGQRTASGEVYHRSDLTAASRSLPLGTRVRVTNLSTGRAVVVRINDRGPYVRGRGLDLSQRAAERIGLNRSGVARVSVARLDAPVPASTVPSVSREWRGKASVSHYTRHHYRRARHYTHHYQYASVSAYHSSHRMVANPVGDWLLRMIR